MAAQHCPRNLDLTMWAEESAVTSGTHSRLVVLKFPTIADFSVAEQRNAA